MSAFVDRVLEAAKAARMRVVLPEGSDPRTVEAARAVAAQGIADVTVLGDASVAEQLPGVRVVDHRTSPDRDRYAHELAQIRRKKGMTLEQAYALLDDELYLGVRMVKCGDADGMNSGACHATGDVLRPALQIIKCAPGAPLVSSFFEMTVANPAFGENGTMFFADCGLNTYPDAEGLAHIALQTAASWRAFMGTEPHVAMLSYSTCGSADDEHTRLVREAARIAHEIEPELDLGGELQFDAALVPSVAAKKAPGVSVAGHANILVFPNLDAGNIGYKVAQRLAGAEAIGPVLQGLAAPVNDLSRGCSADDIVAMVGLTALQARHLKERRAE